MAAGRGGLMWGWGGGEFDLWMDCAPDDGFFSGAEGAGRLFLTSLCSLGMGRFVMRSRFPGPLGRGICRGIVSELVLLFS